MMGETSNNPGLAGASAKNGPVSNEPKTVSLKLFASWEIDKTSSSCIPRLCMFGVTGLQASPELFDDDARRNVILAVQMAGSKRILRSGEISLLKEATETPLDITFSMQYAHFLKRDVNNLRVALQRRNKYKNRTLIGYKTLAIGIINLSQVLQQPKDLDLDLYSKEKHKVVAVITLQNITSKPVSYDDDGKTMSLSGMDPSPESDDEDDDLMEDDLSADDFCSDEEAPRTREQNNFKQKIARLLRRFKSSDVAEKHILTVLERQESVEGAAASSNLDELFDELEDLSAESENEQDNISIRSIRRPTLTQYFDSSETASVDTMRRLSKSESERGNSLGKSQIRTDTVETEVSQSAQDINFAQSLFEQDDVFIGGDATTQNVTSPESAADTTQLSKVFKDSSQSLPEVLYIIDERGSNSYYPVAHTIYQTINSSTKCTALRIAEKDEFREVFKHMSTAIHSFWTNNSRAACIKLILIGGDSFYNQALDEFTQIFSEKASDFLNYVRFLPVPLCRSRLSKHLSHVDIFYQQLFSSDSGWQRLNEKALHGSFASGECSDLLDRIYKYEEGVSTVLQYPVSEAMVALTSTKDDTEDTQQFIPFLTNVLIGSIANQHQSIAAQASLTGWSDGEESTTLSTSPAAHREGSISSNVTDKVNTTTSSTSSSPPSSGSAEPCDLQIEYWVPAKGSDKSKSVPAKETKETLKGFFKYVQVIREKTSFRLIAVTREKRGKMIRIGKKSKDRSKEKETDTKSQNINRDGITRIVCTTKDSTDHLRVHIDDVEHDGVHFFQLSTQWQTHVKYFPIAVSKSYQILE